MGQMGHELVGQLGQRRNDYYLTKNAHHWSTLLCAATLRWDTDHPKRGACGVVALEEQDEVNLA